MPLNIDQIRQKYDAALKGLADNTCRLREDDPPVLIEGGVYGGVWLECAPLEGLIYGRRRPEVARANHEIFFKHQRDDGYLPCWIWRDQIGSAQIQMVVPIAATALETADLIEDAGFLERAYEACGRWDHWLRR
ncbi:MAG: hypothetical protein R3336_04990, partial [Phycisphaeraceae bacterium]|nr:hypothetical protein [Phycisphaeraceae bacterium]